MKMNSIIIILIKKNNSIILILKKMKVDNSNFMDRESIWKGIFKLLKEIKLIK